MTIFIQDYLRYYARNEPDMACLTIEGKTSSYSEVSTLSNQMANGFREMGVQKGERVAILGENSLEHLILFMAASKIGAVIVSLNYRLAPRELVYILKDADAKVLVVNADKEKTLEKMRADLSVELKIITASGSNSLKYREWLFSQSQADLQVELSTEDPFFQLYTSGTTGNPKGVVTSHGNLLYLSQINEVATPVRASQGDAAVICAPMFHIGGAASILLRIFGGVHILLHKSFNPEHVISDIENHTIANIFMVPAMIMAILNIPGIENRDFSKLSQIFYGASPISESVLRRAMTVFKCEFIQLYGMTETTGAATNLSAADHRKAVSGHPEILRSCGRPSLGIDIKIMDFDGQEVSTGEIGEIWIKSPTNMLHYYNIPKATAKNLTDGWVHTGDAGYKDEEGYIFLKDRIKDMVVSGAENIYPVEVENTVAEHPAIMDVAIIGVPDTKMGEALLAVVVLKDGQSLDTEELIAFCREKIAGYKIPRKLKIVNELPRNPTVKVLKKILREPYWKGKMRRIG